MGGLACVFDPMLKDFLSMMKEPPNFEAYREYLEGVESLFGGTIIRKPLSIFFVLRSATQISNGFDPAAVAYRNQGQYAKADELAQKVEKTRAELSSA